MLHWGSLRMLRVSQRKMNWHVANDGELTQAPQPLSPSPEGEGVQGMRQIKTLWNKRKQAIVLSLIFMDFIGYALKIQWKMRNEAKISSIPHPSTLTITYWTLINFWITSVPFWPVILRRNIPACMEAVLILILLFPLTSAYGFEIATLPERSLKDIWTGVFSFELISRVNRSLKGFG